MERILVSACLLGQPVRYDGSSKRRDDDQLRRWRDEGRLIPFCPEVSGGLAVPRPPAEITGPAAAGGGTVLAGTAQVRTDSGTDVTDAFVRGAELALAAAKRAGARMAILKEGSPSCGSGRIYDGTFTGTSQAGAGVTTALMKRNGIQVFSEHELPAAAAFLQKLEKV